MSFKLTIAIAFFWSKQLERNIIYISFFQSSSDWQKQLFTTAVFLSFNLCSFAGKINHASGQL